MAIELDIQKNFKGFFPGCKTEGAGWTYRILALPEAERV